MLSFDFLELNKLMLKLTQENKHAIAKESLDYINWVLVLPDMKKSTASTIKTI